MYPFLGKAIEKAEKLPQESGDKFPKSLIMELEKKVKARKNSPTEEFSKEAEKHNTQTAEYSNKWREDFMRQQEKKEAKEEQL